MPRLNDNKMESGFIGNMQRFDFSGVRTEHLGAAEYTLVTIAIDVTGSVYSFSKELLDCLKTTLSSCKRSPRSNNLLVRIITFSSSLAKGVEELHGFKLLADIDIDNDYKAFRIGGGTPLYDAVFSAVGASNAYAKTLIDDDFLTNGIVFIITDGDDNASSVTPAMIKEEIVKARTGEEIESLISILIGINAEEFNRKLQEFQQKAGIDKYIDAGDVNESSLARLAEFVSRSISSQSQALANGNSGAAISATI